MAEYLRHLFLPHHTNNYRAKVLHIDFFALYVLFFFFISVSFRFVHRIEPDILGFATNITIDRLVDLTNQKRSEAGLPKLKYNVRLSQAAAGKATDMFDKNYWAHVGPDGETPWDFIHAAGYTYTVAGENLAKNFGDSTGVVEAWMNSPTHRENILRTQYEDVGFAVVNGRLNGEETTLVVQMFGKVQTAAATSAISESAPFIPPAAVAQAEETQQTTYVNPSPELINSAEFIQPSQRTPTIITNIAGAVAKKPLFDIPSLTKNMTLFVSIVLLLTLVIDGLYVWHKRIVRIGGKSVAHIFFLFAITGIIWFMSIGSII
jgi:hypothetical protein